MSAPVPIPTTREELNWKVVETYERILDDCLNGVITLAQADYAIRMLIAATGWCVERETFLMMSDWKVPHDISFFERRVLSDATHYYNVLKAPHLSAVLVYRGKVREKVFRCHNASELGDLFERVIKKMKNDGCREFPWPDLSGNKQ